MTGPVVMAPDSLPLARNSEPRDDAKRASRFVVRFLRFASVGFVAYYFPYELVGVRADHVFNAYLADYAHSAGAVLHLFDDGVWVSGATIANERLERRT